MHSLTASPQSVSRNHNIHALLLAKLTPASEPRVQVSRDQLMNRIAERAPGRKLVLVQAPAGFGKTNLLLQYYQSLQRQGTSVMWLNLDGADNDLDRFVLHLHAAYKRMAPRSAVEQITDSPGLIEQLSSHHQPFVLFIDELEVVQSPSALHFIEQILDYLPAHSELVIGTRHIPLINLGRLRARGQILELSHNDLRLSIEETAAIVSKQLKRPVKQQAINVLHDRTEGWLAAIHLATLALPTNIDPKNFFMSFSGSNSELAQFLAEDIISKIDHEKREFLLRTCILRELNADICDYLVQGHGSQQQLQELSRENLFVAPFNSEKTSYRYHGLFASFLYEQLKTRYPHAVAFLHQRAADWYIRNQRPLPAIDHLLQANHMQAALDLLEENAESLLAEGRVRRLLRWFELFPTYVIKQLSGTRLNLFRAWALVLNRHHTDAQPIIDSFLKGEVSNHSPSLVIEARALQCLQLSMTDSIEQCHRESNELIQLLAPDQSLEYGVLTSIISYCLIASNKFEDAKQSMARAMQSDQHLKSTFIRSLSDAQDGTIDLIQGRLSHSLARLESSYERVWCTSEKTLPGGKATIGIPFAEVLYDLNELDRARHILGECLAFSRENGTVDSLITSYVLLTRIALAHGERENALRYIQELQDFSIDCGLLRANAAAQLEMVRLLWLDGDIENSFHRLDQLEILDVWQPSSGYHLPSQDLDNPTIMRWRLNTRSVHNSSMISELNEAICESKQASRNRRALKLRILLCLALDADNKLDQALDNLTEALKVASKEGFVRIFLDEGLDFQNLIKKWIQQYGTQVNSLSISPEFLSKLIQQKEATSESPTQTRDLTPTEALTRRELEVLKNLAEGIRNRAMAERMFVSETTIKAHLRNISAKLGANSRTEAVAIARRHGFI